MLPSIIFAIALSIPFSVAAVPPRRSEPLHIPLIRRRSNLRRDDSADLDRYAAMSDLLKGKYGMSDPSLSRRAQTTDIGTTNQVRLSSTFIPESISHYSTLQGLRYKLLCSSQRRLSVSAKPYENVFALPSHLLRFDITFRAQNLNLVLDTGSSDMWFASTGCTGCSRNTPVLDPKKSSSLQLGTQRVPLNYGSGSASGVVARDTVTMGPFTVNPQTFGVYFPFPPFILYRSLFLPHGNRVFYPWHV